MAAKPRQGSTTGSGKPASRPTATPARAARKPITTSPPENDSVQRELSAMRTRLEELNSVRAELETRLNAAIAAIHKLLDR